MSGRRLWKFFWSWSICQRSAFRRISCSEAELALEPPEAANAPTSTPLRLRSLRRLP